MARTCSFPFSPCKGEEKERDSSPGRALPGCSSGEPLARSSPALFSQQQPGLPKPNSCGNFYSCRCHRFPELSPGPQDWEILSVLRCPPQPGATHFSSEVSARFLSSWELPRYTWIGSQLKAKQNLDNNIIPFFRDSSYNTIYLPFHSAPTPKHGTQEIRVTSKARTKGRPHLTQLHPQLKIGLLVAMFADLVKIKSSEQSVSSLLSYRVVAFHVTKHVNLGLLAYFHIYMHLFQIQLVAQ